MESDLNKARWTALLTASSNGDEATVKNVLAEDASSASCKDANGWTPLMRASAAGHKGVVNLLLTSAQPASTISKNKFGKTALHYACAAGQSLIARVLLMYGSDPRMRDAAGNSAFDDALANGHRPLVDELCSKTPGVGLPPSCDPPVLFKADTSTLTVCWDEVETAVQAIVGKAQVSQEALAALPVAGYKLQITAVVKQDSVSSGSGSGSGSGSRKWTLLSSTIPPGTGTYKVRGLEAASSYVVRVCAYNGYGSGPWSEASDVMTTAKGRPAGGGALATDAPGTNGTSVGSTGTEQSDAAAAQSAAGAGIMFWGTKGGAPARGAGASAQPSPSTGGNREDSREGRLPQGVTQLSMREDHARSTPSPSSSIPDPSPGPGAVRGATASTPATKGLPAGGGGGKHIDDMRGVLRTLQADLEEETTRRRAAEDELGRYRADKATLSRMTVEGLAELEGALETSIKAVRAAKEGKMKEAIGDEVSRTLCSVCMTRPKNILFLPCKHLCACGECAARIMRPPKPSDPEEAAKPKKEPQCPICRLPVREILDVYA